MVNQFFGFEFRTLGFRLWVCWAMVMLLLIQSAPPPLAQGALYKLYTAEKGETLEQVAQRYGVSVELVRKYNPSLPEALDGGELILVPVCVPDSPTAATRAGSSNLVSQSASSNQALTNSSSNYAKAAWVYKVQAGDTLLSIAQKFHVPLEAILKENGLTLQQGLVVGQTLMIPVLHQRMPSKSLPQDKSKPSHPNPSAKHNNQRLKPSASNGNVRIGYVGTVVRLGGRIRYSPYPESPAMFVCPKASRLLIVDEKRDWYGVLMVNGSIGWIHKKYVRREPQALDINSVFSLFAPHSAGVISEAMHYLGTPYKYGGNSPWAMDCSALVQRVFASRGLRLPRTSAEQARVGIPVSISDLRPGDRLYFSSDGKRITHTGIYIGNGQFIHASRREGMVVVSSLYEPRYWRMFVRAMR